LFCFDVWLNAKRRKRFTSARAWQNSSPQPPPSATPSLGLPFFSAELEAVFRKEKYAAKRDVALDPPNPFAGNAKELPKNFDKCMIKKLLNTTINRFFNQFAKFSHKSFFLFVVFIYRFIVNLFNIANI
jgi:hypothetical protein